MIKKVIDILDYLPIIDIDLWIEQEAIEVQKCVDSGPADIIPTLEITKIIDFDYMTYLEELFDEIDDLIFEFENKSISALDFTKIIIEVIRGNESASDYFKFKNSEDNNGGLENGSAI